MSWRCTLLLFLVTVSGCGDSGSKIEQPNGSLSEKDLFALRFPPIVEPGAYFYVSWNSPEAAAQYNFSTSSSADCETTISQFLELEEQQVLLQLAEAGEFYLCLEVLKEGAVSKDIKASNNGAKIKVLQLSN